jgi:phosphate-selective porin OprO/OprP
MRAQWAALTLMAMWAVSTSAQAQQPVQAVLGPPTLPTTVPSPPPLATTISPDPSEVPGGLGTPAQEGKTVDTPETENGIKPVARIIGRINADTILVNQSARNKEIFGTVQNAVGFRRARLGAEGEVGPSVYWKAEFDFAGGNISFKDVFVGLKEIPVVRRLQIGHMSEPFSLEGNESSNDLPFVERTPAYELDPQRNWGVLALSYTDNERATCQFGFFRTGTSNSTGDDISNLNETAYDLRVTGLPWYDRDGEYLMHIGGVVSIRTPANGEVVVGTGPQNSLLQFTDAPATFIQTITIPASQYQLYNLQWATVLGPLSLQAEWDAMNVQQPGGPPVFLNGYYAFASYFLTGEHREYVTKDGGFGGTRVLRPFVSLRNKGQLGSGPGAWEVTARFTYARFTNANIPLENGLQQGDNEAETVLGISWYLNDNTRIMFDYVHVVPVSPNAGPSYANAFFIRTAIFW